jgi:hypothetical protein
VLNRLIGTGPVEVAKSVVLVFAVLIAVIALQQLAANRSTQTAGQSDRSAVLQVASSFGQELTTYDYAHPDVQVNGLQPLVTPAVLARVRRAFPDLALYRAVSVGQPPETYLQSLDADRAEVLVRTHSTMESQFTPPGTRSTGLLLCEVQREGGGWRVADYKWLTPVTEGVSYATRIHPAL